MIPPIPLERNASRSLQEQIYAYFRQRVLDGSYAPGMRIPSSRELAEGLGLSRNTVVLAYGWLASEGYVETISGGGTFICKIASFENATAGFGLAHEPDFCKTGGSFPPIVTHAIDRRLADMLKRNERQPEMDLLYSRVDARQFPIKVWRRLLLENLLNIPKNLCDYPPLGGTTVLREAIAEHLALSKGMVAKPDQILITSGAQEAFSLMARLFIRPGTKVAIECPGYGAAASVFKSYGASLIHLPVDEEGVTIDALSGQSPAMIYTTPSHQFPTGVVMSPQRRIQILDAAQACGSYVLEDDYDGEIIYDRPPLAALAAADRGNRVIYIGSFSKSLGAGLRIGFVVMPEALVDTAAAVKAMGNSSQSWLEQQVLGVYIKNGSFGAHLRRLRQLYRQRRDAMTESLISVFGDDMRISGGDAGMHLYCTLPERFRSSAGVIAAAKKVGIRFYAPEDAGVYDPMAGSVATQHLVVGFASYSPSEISDRFKRLGDVIARGI